MNSQGKFVGDPNSSHQFQPSSGNEGNSLPHYPTPSPYGGSPYGSQTDLIGSVGNAGNESMAHLNSSLHKMSLGNQPPPALSLLEGPPSIHALGQILPIPWIHTSVSPFFDFFGLCFHWRNGMIPKAKGTDHLLSFFTRSLLHLNLLMPMLPLCFYEVLSMHFPTVLLWLQNVEFLWV